MDKSNQSLIKAYIEKAKEKLSVAQLLLKENKYNDAVSRAYYSAFHAAQAIMLTEGLHANTHSGVVTLFGLHFVKTGKLERKFGKLLANLKDDRESGDYEAYSMIDEDTAKIAVKEADEFLQRITQFVQPYL